jgi:hypothetical protein
MVGAADRFLCRFALAVALGLVCAREHGHCQLAPESEALVILLLVVIALRNFRWVWPQLATLWRARGVSLLRRAWPRLCAVVAVPLAYMTMGYSATCWSSLRVTSSPSAVRARGMRCGGRPQGSSGLLALLGRSRRERDGHPCALP